MRTILFKWFLMTIFLLGLNYGHAQCPTIEAGGYLQFNSQAEVDNFIANYPNCTSINGRLIIGSNNVSDITNLNPLQNITSVNGLIIQFTSLENLSGLENITTDNGELSIRNNANLLNVDALNNITQVTDFDFNSNGSIVTLGGLNGITSISGVARINWNNSLTHISGLQNLTSIGYDFELKTNPILTGLEGLSNLTKVGSLVIMSNNSLQNVAGFANLEEITGTAIAPGLNITLNPALNSLEGFLNLVDLSETSLRVVSNASLSSLYGLDSINPESISTLRISSSQQLSTCNIPSICDYLGSGGTAIISGNRVGCNSVEQVVQFCEGFAECPEGNIVLSTQAEVDLFFLQYPNCTTIQGNLFIGSETASTNINSLNGLQNIENVLGSVVIQNTNLSNLNGLNSLVQIGAGLSILDNPALTSLSSLSSLTTISHATLKVVNNDTLSSLNGLENINPETISHLILESSQNLTTCDIESICTYLSTFGSTYSISGNATGCNSFQEVLDACQDTLPQCPEGNIEFMSQAEVDHFAVQYPDCEILNGYLKIGNVNQESDIANLEGLNNISTVSGTVSVIKTALTDLQGLNNLHTIVDTSLEILMNSELVSLEGLENFSTGNLIQIMINPSLESLQGLSGLTHFAGDIEIFDNASLTNLNGLENLLTCAGLNLSQNESLESLDGLSNLNRINGDLVLQANPSLTSLEALTNLETVLDDTGQHDFGGWLIVQENNELTNFDGLDNLSTLGGIKILNNSNLNDLSALSSLTEISGGGVNAVSIGENNSLTSLQGLHNITRIGRMTDSGGAFGDLLIQGNESIENMEGLNSLRTVYGRVWISGNSNLSSFDGFDNFSEIGHGMLITDNPELVSFDGFEHLTILGQIDPFADYILIARNASLENISALSNLTEIDQNDFNFIIEENPVLTSLNGLHNIEPSSINDAGFALRNNPALSECNIYPVCQWLSDGGTNEIHTNATGCNSSEEVLALCELSIEEINDANQITFYPVPAKQILNISIQNSAKIESVNVYDMTGKLVLNSNNSDSKINLSHLVSGTYLVSVKTNKGIHTEKIIKK